MIKISCDLTKQDYVDFNLFHLAHSKTGKKALFIQRYIISIIFLIAPFVLQNVLDTPFWYLVGGFVLAYILWVIFYPRRFKRNVAKQVEKMIDEGKNVSLIGNNDIIIDEEGIERINDKSQTKNDWASVESIEQSDDHIFIYVSAISAHIVPKRAFEDKAGESQFVKQVEEYITKNN